MPERSSCVPGRAVRVKKILPPSTRSSIEPTFRHSADGHAQALGLHRVICAKTVCSCPATSSIRTLKPLGSFVMRYFISHEVPRSCDTSSGAPYRSELLLPFHRWHIDWYQRRAHNSYTCCAAASAHAPSHRVSALRSIRTTEFLPVTVLVRPISRHGSRLWGEQPLCHIDHCSGSPINRTYRVPELDLNEATNGKRG
jgi:hypothetical protein